MDSFDICTQRTDSVQLAAALKSSFFILGTHILAGEVDTCLDGAAGLHRRLFWLLRYYNPLNLSWRYYSILAFRLHTTTSQWDHRHLAIVNYEAHPFLPPLPFVATEACAAQNYHVKRLDPPAALTYHSVLTLSAAFQGLLALHYAANTPKGIPSLPNFTMPFAILGLLRVLVFPWITGKVYVGPFPYPADFNRRSFRHYTPNHFAASAWALLLASIVFLSLWPARYFSAAAFYHHPHRRLSLAVQIMYVYCAATAAAFHGVFLRQGAVAWGNRIPLFDDRLYQLQTLGLFGLIAFTFGLGILDFVRNDFYRSCV